ncbi:hypothetical protein EYF80_023073 [Liparis tanakae]|uniref:Uncharacterized protein n=1 Tax=Liparis tanakae TaxID=230148 RepID=A0A4Z2HNZ8_9TELE|nr:hypothetical protein EYF80_023073 [Liparis tanakae]
MEQATTVCGFHGDRSYCIIPQRLYLEEGSPRNSERAGRCDEMLHNLSELGLLRPQSVKTAKFKDDGKEP